MVKNLDSMIVQPLSVYMVGTYDSEGNPDVMNAAWAAQCGPKHITINFAPIRKTLENIKENKEFSVAYATKDTAVVSDYFGMVSAANNPDKVANVDVTVEKCEHINAPRIIEYPVTLECKAIDIQEIVPERITVTAEVINTVVDEKIIKEDGSVDLSAAEFIVYDGLARVYKIIGEPVAKAFNPDSELLK